MAVFTSCNKDVSVTGVNLDEISLTLTVGETKTLTATVFPEKATNNAIIWRSSHPLVASVSPNGKIEALSEGTTIIEVSTVDGNFTAKCAVIVDKQIFSYEICPYINIENISKTYPIINKFFENQSSELSNTEKLQEFVTWLKSQPCIIEASLAYTYPYLISEILFSFNENGIVKDVIYDILMSSPLKVENHHLEYRPRNVQVKMKNYVTIQEVFDFINSFSHEVRQIHNPCYLSTMSSDSLQYILDCLKAKPYTNGGIPNVYGYFNNSTNRIHISLELFDMMNKDYQADWLKSMIEFQLYEPENKGYIIHFNVPEGTEKFWVAKFMEYEFVEWAELNKIIHIFF